MNNIGVKDLLERGRFKAKHVSQALIEKGVPGNWDCPQNVYNLINGTSVPRDAYTYIVLSDLLNIDLRIILSRFSSLSNNFKSQSQDSDGVDWY